MTTGIPALRGFFAPTSVAVFGASDQPGSVGAAVFANMLAGGFQGELWPVNPRHAQVGGRHAFENAQQLPAAPDLAVVCTPAAAVPEIIAACGARGGRAAVVLTAGVDAAAVLAAARPHGLRVLGPNCVGLRVPGRALNASFSALPVQPGRLALVAQSGGVITAFLGWAGRRGVGLSCCISLGNAIDLTAADLLEALAEDPQTHAILLYLESARDGQRFITAAARAARMKPVFALKVGRVREGAVAAATHTGALAGADNVWEAALLAAGVRRLDSLQDLYGVAELLARLPAPPTDSLTLLTNSGGPAVLAVDALIAGGGSLEVLPARTIEALDAVLPATWSRCNPIDIIGDAPPQRYLKALEQMAAGSAAVAQTTLVLHVPTDLAATADVRRVCNDFATHAGLNMVGCWIGDSADVVEALPAFTTPEDAVRALVHVASATRLQQSLARTPSPVALPDMTTSPAMTALRAALRDEQQAGRNFASQPLVEQLLQIAGIPFSPVRMVRGVEDLEAAAAQLGYPLVLKIQSPDIAHKSDVGGVVTGIVDSAALRAVAGEMLTRCAQLRPGARLDGFQLQRHVSLPHGRELIVGITRDAEFGPVVLFGHGGTAVHVVDDTAIGIAPLDDAAAGALIARTRVCRLLAAWRDWPAADLAAVRSVLGRVAALALAVPEMRELDINPLLAHPGGVLALDARLVLAETSTGTAPAPAAAA